MIDMLFSDEIPYSALKYNRWETNYRPVYTWKPGTEKEGQVASVFDYRMHPDSISFEMYASGDHKSSLLPWLTVDDRGANTYDEQTQVGWQTDDTDMDFVMDRAKDYVIPQGVNKGKKLIDVLTGEGAVGPGSVPSAAYEQGKLLTGSRALVAQQREEKKLDPDDFKQDYEKKAVESKGGTTPYRRYKRYSGGGGSYSPQIYSHPAYSLNADRPAGMYAKIPSYTRFDYLRPSVATKGSREAYRREDF
jgi:hypothetical protein